MAQLARPRWLTIGRPLTLADAYTADAQAIAKDAGIPAQEMEVMLHLAIGGALDAVGQDASGALSVGQVPGVDLSNEQACRTYLSRKYGDQAPIIVREAQAAFAKLPKDVQAYLDRDSGTGELLSNSPHVLLALAARNLGWTGLSRESAEKELAKLQGKKLSAFDLDKRCILNHIVGRGKSRDAKISTAKPAAKAVPSAIQKRIDAIRRDPNYYGGDARLRKVLVAEMADLYQQRSGGK